MNKFNRLLKIMVSFFIVILATFQNIKAEEQKNPSEQFIINQDDKITSAGTYFIKLYADDGTYQYARVHIRFSKTRLDYDLEEGIDAHDVVILEGTYDPTLLDFFKNNQEFTLGV